MRIKNGVTNYYIYGADLLYQITATGTNTSTLTYHYDYRGSTVALSADSGLVTDRIEYSAYGLTTYRVGTNDTPFLFNGRYGVQTDPNGLLYMRARYYNPYLCRFINPDPSGFKGVLNLYAYANGNPVTFLDPYGLNAAATGDSDNSLLYNPNANQVPGQPCMTCHGVSAFGFNGDVNSFYGLPGSGPDALQGYSDVETGAVNATPIVLSLILGPVMAGESAIVDSAASLGFKGIVQDGEILQIVPIEANFSHEFLAEEAGVLVEAPLAGTAGTLAPGAEAFTAFTGGGVTGSMNFNMQVTNPQNMAAIAAFMGW